MWSQQQPMGAYAYNPNGMAWGQQPQQSGFWGQQAAPQAPVLTNFLSPEQMSEIQQYPQQFPAKLSRDEFLRSICTHKQNNRIMLEPQNDGQHRCAICGKSFTLLDLNTPKETIYGICKNMHDLLQSVKTYMLNAPDALKDIYMMLGFIEKIPILWESSVKVFEQASNATGFGLQRNQNQEPFQILGAMLGGAGIPGVGFNPMGGGFYGAPAVPPMAAYQQPGAGQSQAGWGTPAAQPPVYGMTPGYGAAPQAPAAPVPPPAYSAAPAPAVTGQVNPIGYVEPQQGMATTQITMTPMAPNQQVQLGTPAPAPVAPPTVNPNIQTPEKTEVNKTFAPAAAS